MATVALTQRKHIRGVHEFKWTPLTTTNSDGSVAGPKQGSPSLPDKTVHITGTAGSGLSIKIEGSNDNSNWVTLTDPQGSALIFTAIDKISVVQENPLYIRPNVTAGDGSTSITVIISARSSMPR